MSLFIALILAEYNISRCWRFEYNSPARFNTAKWPDKVEGMMLSFVEISPARMVAGEQRTSIR